ncbi:MULTISPECIES: hypothetical protein [Fischerella]|nr:MULTISPECIES: hypothetical protein [Fischerella]
MSATGEKLAIALGMLVLATSCTTKFNTSAPTSPIKFTLPEAR